VHVSIANQRRRPSRALACQQRKQREGEPDHHPDIFSPRAAKRNKWLTRNDPQKTLFRSVQPVHHRPGKGDAILTIQSDRWIREQALATGMIEPFVESQRRDGCISYGLSSYGYDARVSDDFKIFTNVDSAIVDPKNFDSNSFVDRKTDVCVIPPNSFALARTVEYFRVPRDILVICLGKSTYARCGIIVNVTPLEPGWEGHVTLEFSNTTPLPAKIYANEGACQFLFLKGNEPCEVSYADRAGKYMGQRGVTLPRL